MNVKHLIVLILTAVMLPGCTSGKKILYLQDAAGRGEQSIQKYENTLQPDDNLLITVTTEEPELANPFNLMYINMRSTEVRTTNDDRLFSYLIDQNGEIDFPILGKIKLAGLTRIEAENKIKNLLKGELVNPGVNLRVLNFKVSVLGEVVRPGWQAVVGDRITILEALSQAGDLTIYGNRKDIMLVREDQGKRTIASIDLTDPSLITSPYYYLRHNDAIYVKPNKTRINSSAVGPNLTVGLSALSLLVTIIALSTR